MLKFLVLVLFALYAQSNGKKGPCDKTRECARYTFAEGERALCLGYYGCKGATFDTTTSNAICNGAKSCFRGKFQSAAPKVLCNGWKSCLRTRSNGGGLVAQEKIACNGLASCQGIVGGLTAPAVYCDGDISCNKLPITATGATTTDALAYCNGNKACKEARIQSDDIIYCDGDAACNTASLEAPIVSCYGKRVCKGSTIKAETLNAFGWFGVASGTILPESSAIAEIKAYGFNALAYADIETRGTNTHIYAYGFRALSGATIDCGGGSTCHIECKSNACKGVPVYVARNSALTVEPEGCDPTDPNYEPSKKDPTLPAKQLGIHCPVILRAGRPESGMLTDAQLMEKKAAFQALRVQDDEYKQMVEEQAIDDQKFMEYIAERNSDYDELPLDDDDLDESDLSYFYGDQGWFLWESMTGGSMVYSNLLTALAVFILTFGLVSCYYSHKFKDHGYKSLPE